MFIFILNGFMLVKLIFQNRAENGCKIYFPLFLRSSLLKDLAKNDQQKYRPHDLIKCQAFL